MSYQKVNLTSSNLSEEKLLELRRILPEAFSEDKIDWDKLRTVLGDDVDARIEKFGFSWAGKSNAIKNVLIPSKATLNPAPDESVNFDDSQNLFIEGDNLEVLKLLQKAYFEKVKMIYIDPPYNTGGDFVYKDNFASPVKNYLEQTGQVDSEGNKLSTNKETSGRFHSDWLSMMYPRLKLAWNLLRDDGVIFVSIDDNESHHLRILLDEIFGEEHFVAQIVWEKRFTRSNNSKMFATLTETVFLYRKSEAVQELKEPRNEKADSIYTNPDNDPRGVWTSVSYVNPATKTQRPNLSYTITNPLTGQVIEHPTNAWKYEKATYEQHVKEDRLYWGAKGENTYPRLKKFLSEMDGFMVPVDLWSHEETGTTDEGSKIVEDLMGAKVFDFPKPPRLIQRMLRIATTPEEGAIVLDFFAGSGTTAHAVMAQNKDDGGNRKWISVQLPEITDEDSSARNAGFNNIADITKERIRRAAKNLGIQDGFKVFKLAESNYPENTFEFDPDKTEEENKATFEDYLKRAKQSKLIDDIDTTSIIYENIVKEGFSLDSKIQEGAVGNNKVYTITDGERQFSICLDRQIDDTTVKNITEWAKGATFICFDNALDDSAKANIGLHLELKTI